jgi:hypothetical protein
MQGRSDGRPYVFFPKERLRTDAGESRETSVVLVK